MFRSIPRVLKNFSRTCSSGCGCDNVGVNVAVLGAAGGIGQSLSLLLKLNPLIKELRLNDINPMVRGVAMELSHIDTKSKVTGHVDKAEIAQCLAGCDIAVMAGGVARKPGMKREDLMPMNASVVMDWACACAKCCPNAIVTIITNPMNTMVPIACEVYKAKKVLDPAKIVGITALDGVRARTFVAEKVDKDPQCMNVPVICGHSGNTIIPILSANEDAACFDDCLLDEICRHIRNAGTEVVEAKVVGSATLSMAYAGYLTICKVINGLLNKSDTDDYAYVMNSTIDGLCYSAVPVKYGKCGICNIGNLPQMTEKEKKMFCEGIQQVQIDIKKGEDFVADQRR